MEAVPYWMRFVVFLFAASIALTPFLISSRKIGFGWLISLFWGAVSLFSIHLLQVPLQNFLTSAIVGSNIPMWARTAIVIFPSGLIQEIAKAVLPAILIATKARLGTSSKLYGPAAGAGFGIAEAIWLVGLHPGAIGAVAILERFFVIIFHTGLTALAVGGGKSKRIYWGLPAAIIIHAGLNYTAVSLISTIDIWSLEIIIAAVSLAVWIVSIVISKTKD
jgi:hypothetical protein